MAASISARSSSETPAYRPVRRTGLGASSTTGTSEAGATGPPEGSGSGVRALIARPQPLDGDMRVDLRRRERSVAEELLNASQVSATLQEVGRCAVAQPVRAEVRGPRHAGKPTVDQGAHRSGVHPTA